jgi:hypothetical protein
VAACTADEPPKSATATLDPFATSSSSADSRPSVAPATLSVGDCFDADTFTPGTSIARNGVHLVDCAQPHQHQVYAIVPDPDPRAAPFPGDEMMQSFATDSCLNAFEGALEADYQSSDLDFATITPDQTSWDQGDRSIVCAVHNADFEALTGTRVSSLSSERR